MGQSQGIIEYSVSMRKDAAVKEDENASFKNMSSKSARLSRRSVRTCACSGQQCKCLDDDKFANVDLFNMDSEQMAALILAPSPPKETRHKRKQSKPFRINLIMCQDPDEVICSLD